MPAVILDDRLLIEELLAGLAVRSDVSLNTTSYWYYRACRAAVVGAGGHLSGPFAGLAAEQHARAIQELLALPDHIGLADARRTVPRMAEVSRRHPRLNLLNVEAVAAALVLDAEVWLSVPAAAGILPAVLDLEHVAWRMIEIP